MFLFRKDTGKLTESSRNAVQRRVRMYTVKNYVIADSLEQAYDLKQKGRNNIIIGGNLWLKMGHRAIQNAIDLSRLGLDQIEEDADGTLRARWCLCPHGQGSSPGISKYIKQLMVALIFDGVTPNCSLRRKFVYAPFSN